MNTNHDYTYLSALKNILEHGEIRNDRTSVGTKSLFGITQKYDLTKGFPLLTTKKIAWKAIVSELLWFIEGSNDERRLREILFGDRNSEKTTIWTLNAEADYWKPRATFEGDLGRIYGVQWRSWQNSHGETIDQLKKLIENIKTKPHDRRHIITAWNPGELDEMALPPCHAFAQFYVRQDKFLDCLMYQRSNDFFLGCPFNIASYSLFTHLIAQCCDLQPGTFTHVSGDAHIYLNHIEQIHEQLSRNVIFQSPKVILNPDIKDIDDFTMNDIHLEGYFSHSTIKAPMAV